MNTYGKLFRVSIFGESHGKGVGVTVDGVTPGIELSEDSFSEDLSRRQAGRLGTTPRNEADKPEILTGIFNGFTTGAPLTVWFQNTNTRSRDYSQFKDIPRPGHADFVADKKFNGFEDYRGGGHFSGRLTLGLVAAGVIAKKMIDPLSVSVELLEVGGSTDIDKRVIEAVDSGDSIGGIVECTITNVPKTLGEPFFGSVESDLASMVFSIPATKGIEFGSGFEAAKMTGVEHNDFFIDKDGTTETNYAAGINGGITNGNDIVFRVAIKPTSSIKVPQQTMNMKSGEIVNFEVEGRHDTCIALRVPVVLEAASAIVMADLIKISSLSNK